MHSGLFESGLAFIRLNSPRIGAGHRLAKNSFRLSRWSSIDYMPIRVKSVEVLDDYRLRLSFDDGVVTEVDFADDLWGPMAEPLRDRGYFAKVRVDDESRTVVWPNGYDPDPDVLHGDERLFDGSRLRVRRIQSVV